MRAYAFTWICKEKETGTIRIKIENDNCASSLARLSDFLCFKHNALF